jgi:IS5 family transposase
VEVRGDELPKELERREERLCKIQEAKARLEARQAEADRAKGRSEGDGRKRSRGGKPFSRDFGTPPDSAQDNFTDPQSRIMKTSSGFEQCYSGQIAVDEDSQLIVAAVLTNNAADSGQLLPVLDRVNSSLGSNPERVLADAGYRSENNFAEMEKRKIDGYVSLNREGKPGPKPKAGAVATQRMADKLASEEGRQRYRRRKAVVEPVFGWVKSVLGFRSFLLRGIEKASGEWNLVCLAVNLKRYHVLRAA